MIKTKILLIEDDRNLSESLAGYLGKEGFTVEIASTLMEARALRLTHFDVMVLDWMLPDGQGIDYLKELHREGSATPVILLTSRADLIDKVVGLEAGANDYMTKPFEPRELCARIRVQIRKVAQAEGVARVAMGVSEVLLSVVEFAGIRMDLASREVSYRGRPIELAKMEFELLRVLLQNPNRVFPREALLNQVWGYDNYPTTRTVDNHIVQLRQKLDASLIETVRGVGYRLLNKNVQKGAEK